MKNLSLILSLCAILVLGSCGSTTYQNAFYHNKDKFYGEEENDATFLVQLKNHSQLMADMSSLAEKRAYGKALHDEAEEMVGEYRLFHRNLQVLAFKKRIKTPDAVNEGHNEIYQNLFEVNSERAFDTAYINKSLQVLEEMVNMMETYSIEGHDEQVRSFVSKYLGTIQKQKLNLNAMRQKISS